MKTRFQQAAILVVAAMFAAAPVYAKDKQDKQDKQEEKAEKHSQKHHDKAEKRADKREREDIKNGAYFTDQHRDYVRRYYGERYAQARKCPPGLAKKDNGCMPPGQAKKWVVGEPLPRGVVVYEVPRPVLTQLPPAPYGYHYSRVGSDIVLVRNNNNLVVDIILNVLG